MSLCLCGYFFTGCASPSRANIELRKQNQQLQAEVDQLKHSVESDRQVIQSLQSTRPSTPELPQQRLDELFTVAGLKFGRLTGADKNGLKVYIVPVDQQGDELKAAGCFHVQVFDLKAAQPRIGTWELPLAEARKNWYGQGLLYEYVLDCPWQSRPEHPELLIKVSFTDALTHRTFSAEKTINIPLPLE